MTEHPRRAAEQHIRRVRAEKGLDLHGSRAIVKDLEGALKVLSEQLYQKSTHFLLELVQNADDNHYETDTPTIHISYARDHLRIDCNEVGFSPKDVDAICRIGQSTKAGAGVSTQYVGEKGIGFKSVFKAADVVWVNSREYSFKFDKSAPLGMIAPLLDDFPAGGRTGWTSFYMKLSKDYNVDELISELESLDARLLIFLRRLRKIQITIVDNNEKIQSTSLDRTETTTTDDSIVHLRHNNIPLDYTVMRYIVPNLPLEEKRAGVSQTEILLAFPIDGNGQPDLKPQHVYAFLPIREYGFQFLMQADFLLIASREDVDNSSRWNCTLRDAFVSAFVRATKKFNTGPLRYFWPRYLPEQPAVSDFFSPLKKEILRRLSKEPVLEAWNGQVFRPTDLIYVPADFRDHDDIPITISSAKNSVYLSQKYEHTDNQFFKRLGVVEMSYDEFIEDLKTLLTKEFDQFAQKSVQWHVFLARVLNRAPRKHKDAISKLPLIHLRDGEWVSAEDKKIFFPGDSANWDVPGGISLLVAHPEVMGDYARRSLLQALGVQNFSITQITQLIEAHHSDPNFEPSSTSRQDLIAQILFLFKTGWRNRRYLPFWFATEHDDRARGSQLYFDSDIDHSASKFFDNNRRRFRFLHSDYFHVAEDQEGWFQWLLDNMSLANIPRLVRITTRTTATAYSFEMSPDAEFLFKTHDSTEILQLLCDHWPIYHAWIEPSPSPTIDPGYEKSCKALKAKLAAAPVKCKDGKAYPVRDAFLPIEELVTESKGVIPFLAILDPAHPRWQVLKFLGVGVKRDVVFYLKCLEKISSTDTQHDQVGFFLEQIQARYREDEELVRSFFGDKNLIFVPFRPDTDQGAWYPLHQCLWKGPKCLRIHVCLHNTYPAIQRLFTDALQVSDASMGDLMLEAAVFKKSDGLTYMIEVFLEMEKFLEKDMTNAAHLRSVYDKSIWPIARGAVLDEVEELLSSKASSEWFIADRKPLLDSFLGIIPLLAFPVDAISQLERVLKGLNVDLRRLSTAAKSLPRTEGRVEPHKGHTEAFQSKYEFISRLVPVSAVNKTKRKKVLQQLQNMQVFTAEKVVQRYTVTYQGATVEGIQSPGFVVLTPEDDVLKIYLKDGYFESERNPAELVEKLASFSGISERKDGYYLLLIVLTESSRSRIVKALSDHGIPDFIDTGDDDEDWLNTARPPGQLSGRGGQVNGGPDSLETSHMRRFSTERLCVISSSAIQSLANPEDYDPNRGITNGDNDVEFGNESNNSMGPFGNGFRIVAVPRPKPGSGGDQMHNPFDEELAYEGQSALSKELGRVIKDYYDPEDHWTSPLRVRAGHSEYKNSKPKAPFTIIDSDGIFTTCMARYGYQEAMAWRSRPPIWHIEVKATRGGIHEEFSLNPAEFYRARSYSVREQMKRTKIPTDISILVRAFNIESNPEVLFFPDPWELYLQNKLILKAEGSYAGRVLL